VQHSFVVQGVEVSHVARVWLAWHVVVRTLLCRYIRIALTFSIEESETAEDRQPHGWYSVDLRHGAAQGFSWPGVCEAWVYVCVLVMCSM
jgi:hypothetical protein